MGWGFREIRLDFQKSGWSCRNHRWTSGSPLELQKSCLDFAKSARFTEIHQFTILDMLAMHRSRLNNRHLPSNCRLLAILLCIQRTLYTNLRTGHNLCMHARCMLARNDYVRVVIYIAAMRPSCCPIVGSRTTIVFLPLGVGCQGFPCRPQKLWSSC
jgi:hypothetical protein